jgi:hypothetical protein
MSGLSAILLNALYALEPVAMAVALFAILRSDSRRRFRALIAYLTLRLVSVFVLEGLLLHAQTLFHWSRRTEYHWYFQAYWSFYIAGAIAVFFVILELFKYALEPLPGLKRLGLAAFRWVAFIACFASFATAVVPGTRKFSIMFEGCAQLMRCESIFLLSLLFFFMFAAEKLGVGYRSRVFGVSFGFGMLAASNLIVSFLLFSLSQRHAHIRTSAVSILDTGASILMLSVWAVYFLRKEPVRQVVASQPASPLVRWNEIATVLTPTMSRPAMATASHDFFLQDVEKVVDRILTKNSLNVAS